MCRNIKLLYNFDPPASHEEIRASALQYVRKVSGLRAPSAANHEAFEQAVDQITDITYRLLLEGLETSAQPKDRQHEAEKARRRGQQREEQLRRRYGG